MLALAVPGVASALFVRFAPQSALYNTRVLPIWWLCVYLIAGYAVAEVLILAAPGMAEPARRPALGATRRAGHGGPGRAAPRRSPPAGPSRPSPPTSCPGPTPPRPRRCRPATDVGRRRGAGRARAPGYPGEVSGGESRWRRRPRVRPHRSPPRRPGACRGRRGPGGAARGPGRLGAGGAPAAARHPGDRLQARARQRAGQQRLGLGAVELLRRRAQARMGRDARRHRRRPWTR